MSLLRPPVLGTSTVLNKAAFAQTFNIAAASVRDTKNITRFRQELFKSKDLLTIERQSSVVPDPDTSLAAKGRKCLLLKPSISPTKPESWGPVISELVRQDDVGIVPYKLELGYDYWTYRDVLTSLLPPELHDDIPAGFNTAGHVAHLNLREQHLPYKSLIAEVLIDKNQHIKTVINKTNDVGAEDQFRTFPYELLAGSADLKVELIENKCIFRFDYAKVYWNSKLEKEHTRLMGVFKPGEVVCDVMAGIGPFAVPAGKKGVFVWANDYNPESYKYLQEAIHRNKVGPFVRAYNADGRVFIRQAADEVFAASQAGEVAVISNKRPSRSARNETKAVQDEPTRVPLPPTISHFVMNLPASAIEFLPHFRGLYAGHEDLFTPHTENKLPVVHVHCFALKADDEVPRLDVAQRVSKELGASLEWDGVIDSPGDRHEMAILHSKVCVSFVREVSPHKSMYCASFRLPAEVAFAPRN
ncbi:tRNA(m(1)G37)methyltransferase [Gnomoniopsis sp. IMI 355080]|nr:tRNA(m(1)G37)methyltransferase [Gnomoniopsis sp. IMI 355080]